MFLPPDLTCPSLLSPVPNRGILLWLQPFHAMFLKRLHNFKRFYAAIITQLILPLVFVLFSMIVAVTAPSRSGDDPIRVLHINNSALSNENLTVFTVQFDSLKLTDTDRFGFSVCSQHEVSVAHSTLTQSTFPRALLPWI